MNREHDKKRDRTGLMEQMLAYKAFLEGKPVEFVAAVAGVSQRCVQNWSRDDNWLDDKDFIKTMVKMMVQVEVINSLKEIELMKLGIDVTLEPKPLDNPPSKPRYATTAHGKKEWK